MECARVIRLTHQNRCLLVALVLAWPAGAVAGQVYHWVDADGVAHFSQSPPAARDDVETLEIDGSRPASYDPEEDIYNVAAQQEAMQELRDRMAESRKNRQQAKPAAAENTVIYYPEPEYYDEILYPPGYGPRPPHLRPRPPGGRPDRPTAPPPEAPPASKPFRPR